MRGIYYALLAALCNSMIGIFSNFLYDYGMSNYNIAFYRCITAFMIITLFQLFNRKEKGRFRCSRKEFKVYGILAFFGTLVMYVCETTAVKFISVGLVSFLLYASGILTIILGCIFLKEEFNAAKLCSVILVFLGVVIMFVGNLRTAANVTGIMFAIMAGLGYSLYLFEAKRNEIETSMRSLFFIFGMGSIYLSIPTIATGSLFEVNMRCIPYILALAIIPTVGGFFFTNKALSYTEAGKVQLAEMSEPFFAMILGWIILRQQLAWYEMLGGVLVVCGIFVLGRKSANRENSEFVL